MSVLELYLGPGYLLDNAFCGCSLSSVILVYLQCFPAISSNPLQNRRLNGKINYVHFEDSSDRFTRRILEQSL